MLLNDFNRLNTAGSQETTRSVIYHMRINLVSLSHRVSVLQAQRDTLHVKVFPFWEAMPFV